MTWHTPVWHWLAHAAVAALVILSAGGLAVRLCREPARKALLIELTLLGCLLAPWAGLLLRWRAGAVQLAWLCRSAGAPPAAVARVFREVAGPAGGRVRLLASDRAALPLMFCWWRPVIVLPARLCRDGDTPALRYCLAHEWSHGERRDARAWHLAALA